MMIEDKQMCDSDVLEALIAGPEGGIVEITERNLPDEPERKYWLLDRAILIPENTTVILKNCKLKLSDNCRDNFFRSANCGIGITDIKTIRNIHLIGVGHVVLEGADHPRSTGDESKILKCPCPKTKEDILGYGDWLDEAKRATGELDFFDYHGYTYGTDAEKPGERNMGDWRNIGILFACVEQFSIRNLQIIESHGWGISLENCAHGQVDSIRFDAKMQRVIDGMLHNIENQDGVDLRNGCHDIILSNIMGQTGDDLIALTAIAVNDEHESGALDSTHIMHNDFSRRNPDIHDIVVRNVVGRSQGGSIGKCCSCLRLLSCESRIYNIVIDGLINVHEDGLREADTILLGEGDGGYGRNLPNGLSNIIISNVIADSLHAAICVKGYLSDSMISNVINKNPDSETIFVKRPNGLANVLLSNVQ